MKGAKKRRKSWFVKGHQPVKKQTEMDKEVKTDDEVSLEAKSASAADVNGIAEKTKTKDQG